MPSNLELPIINPASIPPTQLDLLLKLGFCHVKFTDPMILTYLKTCLSAGKRFFLRSLEEKMQWQLDETLDPTEQSQGYILRSDRKSLYKMEQFFFEPGKPLSFLNTHASILDKINAYFFEHITLPIIKAIFQHCRLSLGDFIDATTLAYRLFTFQSYPALDEGKNVVRFNAHKDFGLFTVLFYEEPGLEVQHDRKWYSVSPQLGTVVINTGNALEMMTNGRCHSAVHRVVDPAKDRKSIVHFVNPNYQRPVKNYVTNELISLTGAEFFKKQFAEHYTEK